MNKILSITLGILFLLVIAVLFGTLKFSQSPTGKIIAEIKTGGTINIEINDNGFSPQLIYAKIGDKITWENKASTPQTVTSPDWGSNLLFEEDKYTLIITEQKEYDYFSIPKESFKGKIIVLE